MPAHGAFERVDEHHSFIPGEQRVEHDRPGVPQRTKEMVFVSLHHHTTFSFKDGYGLPEAHVRRAAELGMSSLAVTEHGNVSSFVGLEKAANAEGLKPIFGVELYTGDISDEKRTQRKNHLTVLAADQAGYRNLNTLVTRSYRDGFYYEPTASPRMLAEHRAGLIFLSGCQGSLLATSLTGGKNVPESEASYGRAKRVAAAFRRELGDAYYLEVQAFPELERTVAINTAFERLSKELGIPLAATADVHYTQPNESEIQQILHNIRGGNKQTLEEQAQNWGYDVKLSPPTSDSYIYQRLRATGLSRKAAEQAIRNTAEIASMCNVVLPKSAPLRYPLPRGYTSAKDLWIDWLKEGWAYRGIDRRSNRAAYAERLRYERSIIEPKDFLDYFLVVSDLVKFAKDAGIAVGPARGSAAASLACWLLRITEVDPLLYPNLVFERFIDHTRADLPDIDLDFDDERRGEIRDYAVRKYGGACVGNIGAFSGFRAKNSLDDVARAFRIPQAAADTIKELLIERSSGDLRASATIEDTVEYFEAAQKVMDEFPSLKKAMDLEGQYKGLSVHAAGLVISATPLTELCATYWREVPAKSGNWIDVVAPDKYDAEYLNILKMDILGLKYMGMIGFALKMIGMTLEEFYELSLEDPKVLDGFIRNDTAGIFQFDGRAMRNVTQELKPDSFTEICDANALVRPGPLHSGATADYIDAKWGRKPVRHLHPMLDAITGSTHGQIVYQEQILRVVTEIGKFEWTHAAYIRKIISKKIGEQEFQRQWSRFLKGALENDVPEKVAAEIWRGCITAGSYAFNAAHCVSYGMIAYWTMYLKVHHEKEFYAAVLRKLGDVEKHGVKMQLPLLQDAIAHGVKILPPSVAASDAQWKPVPGKAKAVRAGFEQIPGIGDKMAPTIVAARDLGGMHTWGDLLSIRGIGQKTVDLMAGFANAEDPFGITYLERVLDGVRNDIGSRALGALPRPTHKAVDIPYNRSEEDVEVVWVGQIVQRNLKDLFEVHFSRTGESLDPGSVKDANLREWVTMVAKDETEMVNLTISRWKYSRFKKAVWGVDMKRDVVLVHGKKKGNQSRRAIQVDAIWVITPE